MKTCSRCRVPQAPEAFPWRNQGRGERGTICKVCMRFYNRDHYGRNKPTYLARAAAQQERLRQFVRQAKARPCADCGQEYPYWVMDFDHLGDKAFTISHRGTRRSITEMKREIAKCDVVCANCHRQRTHDRPTST